MSLLTQNLRQTRACSDGGTLTLTDLGESGAIVMLSERDQMLTINPSAAYVLQHLLGTSAEIDDAYAKSLSALLAERFAITQAQAHTDIANFFEQLNKWL